VIFYDITGFQRRTFVQIISIYRYADDIWFSDHIPEHITSFSLSSELAFAYNGKTRKGMIMKIFALCIGLVFGIIAIAVYAYGLKQRIKDVTDKSDEKN
jgi:hypothetical protein